MQQVTVVSVAGDSGCGKTTFVNALRLILGPERALVLDMDDYHSLDRVGRRERGITALNPDANNLELAAAHMACLRHGERVMKPVYNHANGTFGAPEPVESAPVLIMHGLLPLATEALRQEADLKVYFDAQPELKIRWKIHRDVSERGHRMEDVMREIVERLSDFRRYIDVQKIHADLILTYVLPFGEGEGTPWLWIAELAADAPLVGRLTAAIAHGFPARRLHLDVQGRAMEAVEVRETVSGARLALALAEIGAADLAVRAAQLESCTPAEIGQWLLAWRIEHERVRAGARSAGWLAQG